uniref:Uncharacterized protein n=1 Tax=Romanomermis culicivorax TaxID=13658 RepID=A0A915JUI7_ROMCU
MSFTSIFSWLRITKLDVIHTQAIMFSLWTMVACGSFFFLLYWQVRDRFVVHGQLLMDATGQAGIRHHETLILLCGIAMAVWVVCATVFYPAVIIVQGDLFTFALSYGSMNYEKLHYLLLFGFCYGVFAWSSAICIFTFICLCDFLEFRHFNKLLRKLNVQENWDELYRYFDQYYKLLIAVDHCNRSFSIDCQKIAHLEDMEDT